MVFAIKSEEKATGVESVKVVLRDGSDNQEWRAFMAGQTWIKDWWYTSEGKLTGFEGG